MLAEGVSFLSLNLLTLGSLKRSIYSDVQGNAMGDVLFFTPQPDTRREGAKHPTPNKHKTHHTIPAVTGLDQILRYCWYRYNLT